MIFRYSLLMLFSVLVCLSSGRGEEEHPLQTAYNLEKAGEWEEAFLTYLGIDNMAHAAVRIGRKDPARFLKILEGSSQEILPVSKGLVKGDLLLALDRKEEALETYREIARSVQNAPDYPVDLSESFQGGFSSHRPIRSFEIGPGSHRDNWLLRRFIALDSLPDTEAEFALDYAFFLRRQQQEVTGLNVLAEALLATLFEQGNKFGNYPYGLNSSADLIARHEKIIAAIAPYANAEDFDLMLDYPISSFWAGSAYTDLGRSIRQDPAVVDVLLKAYDVDWNRRRVEFAQALFKAVGPDILPALREGLKSEDRIVRSNAARACGAIGDPSVIPQLIEALDLESGLSRASIVWALGELKAEEGMTELSWLHAQAIADERQHAGSGYRFAQIAAESQDQFSHIESMDVIAADWDELKASNDDPPVNPRKYENLLSTGHVIRAAAKMDATKLQGFWPMRIVVLK